MEDNLEQGNLVEDKRPLEGTLEEEERQQEVVLDCSNSSLFFFSDEEEDRIRTNRLDLPVFETWRAKSELGFGWKGKLKS